MNEETVGDVSCAPLRNWANGNWTLIGDICVCLLVGIRADLRMPASALTPYDRVSG